MTRVITKSSKKGPETSIFCNFEKDCRDCIKAEEPKLGSQDAPNAVLLCSYPMKRVTCALHSTWCIMICLVIPIVSLLQSLSKLLVVLVVLDNYHTVYRDGNGWFCIIAIHKEISISAFNFNSICLLRTSRWRTCEKVTACKKMDENITGGVKYR